ncbi:hypothetical protein Bca101_025828 [Brassica carinata]
MTTFQKLNQTLISVNVIKGRYKAWDSLLGMQRAERDITLSMRSLQINQANCGHLTPHELKERQVRLGNARPAIQKILTVSVMRHIFWSMLMLMTSHQNPTHFFEQIVLKDALGSHSSLTKVSMEQGSYI